jgi:hypothetical protein
MIRTFGWLLGIEQATSIDQLDVSLAAPWVQDKAFWIFLLVVALMVGSLLFYLRLQQRGSVAQRIALGLFRGALLALLLVTLADPVLEMTLSSRRRPLLYVIFDGTDSMAIEDELPDAERAAVEKAVGYQVTNRSKQTHATEKPTRIEYVQSLLRKPQDNLLAQLANEKHVEIEAYLFDGNTTSQLRKLNLARTSRGRLDPAYLAEQLTTKGQVTALGEVVSEIGQQLGSGRAIGAVVISDFAHNSGIAPLGSGPQSPAARLNLPIYAVGVGASEAIDLAVDLQTDPRMKKAERSNLAVKLRQSGLAGQAVTVRVTGKKLSGEAATGGAAEINVGQKTITLKDPVESIDLPFTPEEAGRYEFVARADKLDGEVVDQNNVASRQVNIIDDYLRLMYVAYEPTWEWRFIKEVFHRDKLVGMDGFRTFLSSSDPRVRESNVLFLPTLTPKRSEFFASDVIFLDDMPRSALTDRFCELTKEYVGNLGGGLVVIAGPRFGPRELHQTPLAEMLPVIIDPSAEMRTAPAQPEFRLRRTPHAARYPFMELGATEAESSRAWDNLGKLPWYQPVAALHEQAFALAEHPTDKCADGKTPQPLIAMRQYGKGEVVYLGFNEMWRLRRQYGEKYYRQFWSQLIYRLGMSHALGAEKRFVVRLDQQQYRAEDKVTLTVEAYDANYEPLRDEGLNGRGLAGELIMAGKSGSPPTALSVPMLRQGVFETRIPVFEAGSYSVRVTDPVTGKLTEQRFEVTPLSAERRRGVRDEKLQQELAAQSGGKAYDLTSVHRLPDELRLDAQTERLTRSYALWTTPLWFCVAIGLMLGEWLFRKVIRLP